MRKYLLDTNICIYFLKGQYNIDEKIKSVGVENCFISDITVAELKFGAENSKQKANLNNSSGFPIKLGMIDLCYFYIIPAKAGIHSY